MKKFWGRHRCIILAVVSGICFSLVITIGAFCDTYFSTALAFIVQALGMLALCLAYRWGE